jgi:hypothetical protein
MTNWTFFHDRFNEFRVISMPFICKGLLFLRPRGKGLSNYKRNCLVIIVAPFFIRYFTLKFASAITLYPFIILNSNNLKNNKTIINHERIHLKQQIEMLVLPFYIWYLLEFSIRLLQHSSVKKAYRAISFEKESYANEMDDAYLERRSFWHFLTYI